MPSPEQPLYVPDGTGKNLTWEIVNADGIQCETDRSSDYYGLGVRLGIYMSWLTGWVANNFVPEEIPGALDQNAIFLFALVIAVGRCTITNLVSRMDAIVLVHLATGSVFSVNSIWGYRTCIYRNEGPRGIANFGGFGTHLRLLLSMTVCSYAWWFWYYGMSGALGETKTGTGPCEQVYTFIFAKLNASGSVRIWYIIVYIACMIYFGTMTIVSVTGPVGRLLKMKWLGEHRFFHTSTRLKFATGFSYGQLRYIFYTLRAANFLLIVYSMVKVEYTLNYNHIASVLGENGRIFFPSQLLPTIIGAGSLIRVCYLLLGTKRASKDHKPSLAQVPTNPTNTTTFPHGRGLLKIFVSPTQDEQAAATRKHGIADDELDPDMRDQVLWWRMLVSWLPWLQAVTVWWKTTPAEKRDEEHRPVQTSAAYHSHPPQEKNENEKGVERRDTWNSENTLAASPMSANMPKVTSKVGN